MTRTEETGHIEQVEPRRGDALLVVDPQRDFLPGGALSVPRGDRVLAPLARGIEAFTRRNLPVYVTRDWHPPNHCSFHAQGGPWPSHCVAHSPGAAFSAALRLPATVGLVSKATSPGREACSAFAGTDLLPRLRNSGVKRLFVGGLATDHSVLRTVLYALAQGFAVVVLRDAVAAENLQPGDGERAVEEMGRAGAVLSDSAALMAGPMSARPERRQA
ncbi:isochorismatase family protein [Azohydromonas aeria]|uniref:isochorismatase family protein n=1 Tax=Azohydromonas aeria TaxID=2590212 RepID=UPI0012F9AEC8|nr:isochorismatase family protein [Azohydromonas aeria]